MRGLVLSVAALAVSAPAAAAVTVFDGVLAAQSSSTDKPFVDAGYYAGRQKVILTAHFDTANAVQLTSPHNECYVFVGPYGHDCDVWFDEFTVGTDYKFSDATSDGEIVKHALGDLGDLPAHYYHDRSFVFRNLTETPVAYHIKVETFAIVPEPASWAMMIAGFGLLGSTVRRRKVAFA